MKSDGKTPLGCVILILLADLGIVFAEAYVIPHFILEYW